ncbi:MAG TPA: DUF202 domain-containing protein [Bryobacteraceae bacterium]|nr:DUF202 domain-containing protein [Bryobacteraceae bacterium]
MPTNQIEQTHPALDASTRLAVERTRLSYERTLMAWVRTATSLITFGFSIYKFFQLDKENARLHGVIGPRTFAILMVLIGLACLLIATAEHTRDLRTLKEQYPDIARSPTRWLAALISILGVVALAAIILRR